MNELSWKTAGQCLLQEQLHLEYPHDKESLQECMYESCTQTWQGCNKAVLLTTRLFDGLLQSKTKLLVV